MPEPRKKTLSYHRAEYLCDNPSSINLALCIKQATSALRTISERSIQRAGGYMTRLAHYEPEDRAPGCLLHLTFETPGEHASVVPRVGKDASEVRVSTIPPPNDAEFMDGDAFLYVNGNDTCVCTTAISIGTVRQFLHGFFSRSGIRSDAGDFEFLNALDTKKFALIQQKGIQEIELRSSMYKASADYHLRQTHVAGLPGGLTKAFRAILGGSEHDVSDDALRVGVTVTLDKRRKPGIALGHKRLEQMASNIIQNQEDGDEYTIILESGEKIKPHELVLRKTVELDSMGKSVSRDAAWGALLSYYGDLMRSGQLEQ